MFDLNNHLMRQAVAQVHRHPSGRNLYAVREALRFHRRVRNRGRVRGILAVLFRRSRRLLDLTAIEKACKVRGHYFVGARAVPIRQIRGSEGRCGDFDVGFNPIRTHTRDRWLGIAMARWAGTPLPPVELIQVGDIYFVRDGHHRISVARAMGQLEIDAVVTVYNLVEPLPWERAAAAWGLRRVMILSCPGRLTRFRIRRPSSL